MRPEIGSVWFFRATIVFLIFTSLACLQGVFQLGIPGLDDILAKDKMAQTGYLTILPALWFSMRVEARTISVCRDLDTDKLVRLPADEISMEHFARGKVALWQRRGAIWVGGVVFAGFTFFYYFNTIDFCNRQGEDALRYVACHHGPAQLLLEIWTAPFVVVSVIFGFVTGARLGTLAGSSMLARHITESDTRLNVFPTHADEHGGFGRFSYMINQNGLLAAVPVVWLTFWMAALLFSKASAIDPFRDWVLPFLGQWILAVGFLTLCFIAPAVQFTRAFRRVKAQLNSEISEEAVEDPAQRQSYHDQRNAIRSLPDYPIRGNVQTYFSTQVMVTFFSVAFSIFFALNKEDEVFHRIGTHIKDVLMSALGG